METKTILAKKNQLPSQPTRRNGSFEKHMDTLRLLAGCAGYLGQGVPRTEHNSHDSTIHRA